ncbi:hypothetical protein K523DRAFT_349263 [Schizophyllum commune Tattone D]|nr:hypothetical protein K523DRAFT_349263 [Schizophyllum commune Tattone D]
MPPKKKSTSKGSLKNSTSQQRTLFDHFQKKGKPDANAETSGSAQGSQELKPEAPPSSPPQIIEPELVDASAEAATTPSPAASSPWTNPPPSSGPPSSPLPIEIEVEDEKDTPAAPVPPTTPRKALKPQVPSTAVIGTSRDAPIVIASPPGPSKPAHPFFKPRVAPPSPSKAARAKVEELPPVYPDSNSQHVRGPQLVHPTHRAAPFPPRQSTWRDVDEHFANLASLNLVDRDANGSTTGSSSQAVQPDTSERESYLATIPEEHRGRTAISLLLQDREEDSEKAHFTWAQQCMPQSADAVLGNERNATYLRDWLRKLQLDVSSLASSSDAGSETSKPKPKPKAAKRPIGASKRRTRKRLRLDSDDDNFIVETGDDYAEEDEEEEWGPVGGDEDEYVPTRLQRKDDSVAATPSSTPPIPPSISAPAAPLAYANQNVAPHNPYMWMPPQTGAYYPNFMQFAPMYSQYMPYPPAQAYPTLAYNVYPQPVAPNSYPYYNWPPPAAVYPPVPPPAAPTPAPPPTLPTLSRATQPVRNAILLAGPSGSGKTAAVYACAAELGFEVFEVYPGIGRRNGASVDHLVGNVGRNHMVRQARADAAGGTKAKNAFAALMKPKAADEEPPAGSASPAGPASPAADAASPPTASKENSATFRQSLILLEEVDILFKEDTNFWPSLVTFIKSSRRPVVLTCNDLSIVPLWAYDIPLQHVLHFSRCPAPLATSLLQSLCYKHARLVPREDVARFCDSRFDAEDTRAASGCDLRHAINALQLHCTTRAGGIQREEEEEPDVLNWEDAEESGGGDPVVAAAARSVHRRRQAVHSELLSFMDAHACIRSLGQIDPWARSAPADDDELGHQVLFDLPSHPDVDVAFRDRVGELAATAVRLSARAARGPGVDVPPYLPPSSPPRPPACYGARALFRARVENAERVSRLRGIPVLASAGGGEALFLDYLPYVRHMAATDDELERLAMSGAGTGGGVTRGRTTRNSLRAQYIRTVDLTEGQREALAASALVG